MRTFKGTSNLKWILILAATNALMACSVPKPEENGSDGNSNFLITSASGVVATTTSHEVFSIPTARLYNFSACLKDLARGKPLTGQPFRIKETSETVKADSNGCLNWSEKIEFDYLASSAYVPLSRTLIATGLARGTRAVHFAINPWAHGESLGQAVDLDKQDVEHLVKETESQARLQGLEAGRADRSVWVEDGRFLVSDDRLTAQGLSLTYQLSLTPKLALNRLNGERYMETLTRGRFRVGVFLIHQDQVGGKAVRRVFGAYEIPTIEMSNDSLPVRAPMILSQLPKSGQIFIGLRLVPQDGPASLGSFDGLYPLGDYRQIKASTFLKISPLVSQNPGFRLDAFLTEASTELKRVDPEPMPAPKGDGTMPPASRLDRPLPTGPDDRGGDATNPHYQRAQVLVDHLTFDSLQRGQENVSRKEVRYKVRACLKSGIDNDLLASRAFEVSKFQIEGGAAGAITSISTDHTSCLYWDETLTFDPYECQRFLKGSVRIRNADLGMDSRIEYAINPWPASGPFAFDLRDVDQTKNLTFACDPQKRLRGHIDLDSIRLVTQTGGYDYEADAGLNLLVRKRVQLRLAPQVLNYSNLTQGIESRQPLRDGAYVLRVVVLRTPVDSDPEPYLTHWEGPVVAIAGRIDTDIELLSHDLKSMGNRNLLLVDLRPARAEAVQLDDKGRPRPLSAGTKLVDLIDANSELVGGVFSGTVVINEEDANKPLKLVDASALSSYLVKGETKMEESGRWLDDVIQKGVAARAKRSGPLSAAISREKLAEITGYPLVNLKKPAGAEHLLRALNVDTQRLRGRQFAIYGRAEVWKSLVEKTDPLPVERLKALAEGTMGKDLGTRMCALFVHHILGNALMDGYHVTMMRECMGAVADDPNAFFSIERLRRVEAMDKPEYLQGVERNLTVSTSFSLSRSLTESFSFHRGLSASAGVKTTLFGFLGLGIDGNIGVDWSTTDATTNANTSSISESTTLFVQESPVRLKVKKSEACAVVRMNPSLFQEKPRQYLIFRARNYADFLRNDLTQMQKVEAAQRSILVCSGETVEQAFEIVERYYMISQYPMGGSQQDAADPRNRSLFMAIRGRADYDRFVNAIKGVARAPVDAGPNDTYSSLGDFLDAHFKATPTLPGYLQRGP